MTGRTLDAFEKEVVRGMLQVGTVACDQKCENGVHCRHMLLFKIGHRFWNVSYKDPTFRDEALFVLAGWCIADIIVGLRLDIQNMYTELGELHEILAEPSSLSKEADTYGLAWLIMTNLDEAVFSIGKNPNVAKDRLSGNRGSVCASFSIGGYSSVAGECDTEKAAIQRIVADIGKRVVMHMLKEHGDLEKRCGSVERVTKALWSLDELNGKLLFEEKAEKPVPNSKKRKPKS